MEEKQNHKVIKKAPIYSKIIEDFIKAKDNPKWFRALSEVQLVAAESLLYSIRDDTNQLTTHRTRATLQGIGIRPVESSKNLREVIKLSRGNDLAFLQFLMEKFYSKGNRQDPNYKYNLNEQLIMTSIAHLDMITTLRELDRILPKQPKKEVKVKVRRVRIKPEYSSPYLAPLVKPKVEPKIKSLPPLRPIAILRQYEKYLDPNYIVPNESSRWFAGKKQTKGNDGEEDTESGLTDKGAVLTSNADIVKSVLRDQISNILARATANGGGSDILFRSLSTNRKRSIANLCKKHKEMEQKKISLMNRLKVEARNRCLRFFGDEDKNEKQKRRFHAQLEKDLAKVEEEYEQLQRRYETQTWMRLLIHELVDTNTDMRDVRLCNQNESMDTQLYENILARCQFKLAQNGVLEDEDLGTENNPPTYDEGKRICDFGHFGKPKCNQIYFNAPTAHRPFKFDHMHIFNEDDMHSAKEPFAVIKRTIERIFEGDKCVTEDEAIAKCFGDIWKREVESWNTKYKEMDEKLKIEKQMKEEIQKQMMEEMERDEYHIPRDRNLMNDVFKNDLKFKELDELKGKNHEKQELFRFEEKYYDPRDKHLMNDLLKNALKLMRKNGRYVLAGLPEAYKIETLREWIKARYGYVVSEHERNVALKKSLKVFQEMRKIKPKIRLPTRKDLSEEKYVTYKHRDTLLKKTKVTIEEYFNRLRKRLLQDAKIYYLSLEPFHCSNGPANQVFYDYLPTRPQDILPFRPWNSTDFMNAKKEWEIRMGKNK